MGHHHHHGGEAGKNISTAFWLNAVFVVIEAVGGLLTNSIAILSDCVHDLGDCASLGLAWWLQRKSLQHSDKTYTYGYKRFSLLGSVFLSAVLLVSSIVMLYSATRRIINPVEVEARGMFWLAIAGVVINGAAAFRLKRGSSLNERAVYLHIMEDILGWVAVLVASIVMLFVDIPILDPIMSAAISIWILWNVAHNLKDSFRIMLQAAPEDLDVNLLRNEIMHIDNIDDVHDLHVWTLDGETHVMTLHVVTQNNSTVELKQQIHEVAQKHHIDHVTVEIEHHGDPCLCNCQE